MSHSLAPECTPLKHAYDSCFKDWFAGYLQSQSQSPSNGRPSADDSVDEQTLMKEYQEKCGKVWKEYQACLSKAVKQKGLDEVLDRAREEMPLRDMKSPEELCIL